MQYIIIIIIWCLIFYLQLYRCNTKWYDAPLKTQKLIFFLIQKTTKCYKIDAGGMFNPCLEGLATVGGLIKLLYMYIY